MKASAAQTYSEYTPKMRKPDPGYDFTEDWFSKHIPVWDVMLDELKPSKVLEIGSFEGRSTSYIIETICKDRDLNLICCDTWGSEEEEYPEDREGTMARFKGNIGLAAARVPNKIAMDVLEGPSCYALAELLHRGFAGTFDLIYIDGSHRAPDVLTDAVLAYLLLADGGMMVFDDYLFNQTDILSAPKLAIDCFSMAFSGKMKIISAPLYQVWMQKIGGDK